MSVDASKQLYRRWLLELWNGNLAITDQIVNRIRPGTISRRNPMPIPRPS